MYNKAVGNYSHALKCVLESYKSIEMRDKAVDTYPSTIKFVSECYIMLKKCAIEQFIDAFCI